MQKRRKLTRKVNEAQAYEIGRQLTRDEGILSGISTGAAVYTALQIGCRPENRDRFQNASDPEDTAFVDVNYQYFK